MNQQNMNKLKCVFIGDYGCGKTSFVEMIINNTKKDGSEKLYCTFPIKTVSIDRKTYKLEIWDTAGQEKYNVISRLYYREAVVCFLMYDITNKHSFNHIEKWYNETISGIGESNHPLIYILIGNKCELINERQVSYEKANGYAKKRGFLFHEISVHKQINISSALITPMFELFIINTNEYNISSIIEKVTPPPIKHQTSICSVV
ncbi:Ras-related protein Rab11A [Entamoeba marina]